jgi:Caspase domain
VRYLRLKFWVLIFLLSLALPRWSDAAQRGAVTDPPHPVAKVGRKLIAVIGIDKYEHWGILHNAVSDAEEVAKTFEQQLGFIEPARRLENAAATKDAIWSLVEDTLHREVESDDDLVLLFSGHGTSRSETVGDKTIDTGYLVPVEAQSSGREERFSDYIQIDPFLDAMSRLPARHILVILDSCNSGFALGQAVDRSRGQVKWKPELASRVSRRVITSAQKDQLASDDGPLPGHSLFAGELIQGIRDGTIDVDHDGMITSTQLGEYLQNVVANNPKSHQTPDFGSFSSLDDRGEMVLETNRGSARHALLIANWKYPNYGLEGPKNDVAALAKVLGPTFATTVAENLDLKRLRSTISSFGTQLRTGDTAFIYFTGRAGISNGDFCLFPIDLEGPRAGLPKWQASSAFRLVGVDLDPTPAPAPNGLPIEAVLDVLGRRGNGANIVVVDSCLTGEEHGAFLAPYPRKDTFVGVAASPGQNAREELARDGHYRGVFSEEFTDALSDPDNDFETAFMKAAAKCLVRTNQMQRPWPMLSNLRERIFLTAPSVSNAQQQP